MTQISLYLGSIPNFANVDHDGGKTSMNVRRVKPKGGAEHVQIEIEIVSRGPRRTMRRHGTFRLSPEEADKLVIALTRTQPEVDEAPQMYDFSTPYGEREKLWTAFYGIKEKS